MHQQLNASTDKSASKTALYLAVQANDEAAVQEILASSAAMDQQINSVNSSNGWTPLLLACAEGLVSIARLLLAAGANQDVVDLAGWTAKEYAVFRGLLKLANLFAATVKTPAARLKPKGGHRVTYQRRSSNSQVFVYLGPSHTRSNLAPVVFDTAATNQVGQIGEQTSWGVVISSQGTCSEPPVTIKLPIQESMVNKPLRLSTMNSDKIILKFEVYSSTSPHDDNIQTFGTAIALLQSLQQGLAPHRENITRHYTIPLLQKGTMMCVGNVTFSVLLINPYYNEISVPQASSGFWNRKMSYPIVGHRGSGANSTGRTVLQIGENTYQSFVTAIDRGASCIEFDVQLTKDHHPVIYHDFLAKEIGGDISVHELTFDQFQYFSRSQAPKSDKFGLGEQKYIENTHLDNGHRPRPRRHSLNEYDHSRSEDLIDRIKHTDEGLRECFKGNIRGLAIQEPSTNLEQLLISLPEHINFDLEIKYPMLWEAEDRAMEFVTIELNTYVDTILRTIFRYCGRRDITLTSFSPEVCIALACKQQSFPILMINKAGTVPVSDIRAGSLKGAIDFATAWGLDGVVVISDPFVMCPRLLTYTKDSGLVVASYGELNNNPECALVSIHPHL